MNDDWRLRVDLHKDDIANLLTAHLEGSELEHDLETTFHDRVIVSADGPQVFCYTGTREQADRAEQVIRSVATERKWDVDFELKHWHPVAEEWEDPDVPLPADAEDRAAEHAEMIRQQRAESAAQGHPNYEVRVQCESHHDTRKLADQLEQEGLTLLTRTRRTCSPSGSGARRPKAVRSPRRGTCSRSTRKARRTRSRCSAAWAADAAWAGGPHSSNSESYSSKICAQSVR
jgi:hypothetical protein